MAPVPSVRLVVAYALTAVALAVFTASELPATGEQRAGPSRSPIQTFAITNATIIDVISGEARPGSTIVVAGNQITQIGRSIRVPRDAVRVDATGKFVIPGFWDMHSHNQASGAESLALYLAHGVVGTRDMGSELEFIVPLRDRIRRGEVLGPEIYAAGPILDEAPSEWPFRRRVTNAEDARAAVRDLKQGGVDFIKVHNFTPREAFFAITNEAQKVGLTVAGHIPLKVSLEEGLASGMASIEHFSESRLFRECPGKNCEPLFAKIVSTGVYQTPTGVFSEAAIDGFAGKPMRHAEYANEAVLELNRRQLESFKPDAKVLTMLRSQIPERRAAVKNLHAKGARFLAGCDGWVPGFCLHDELQWLTESGLSPLQALQTATINPAKFLGREKTQGTVEIGKRGDLVLLDADPRTEIRNASRIHAVLVQGRLLQRSEIDRLIAARRRR